MTNLLNQLEFSLHIQEPKTNDLLNQLECSILMHKTITKTNDTELRWVGWDFDYLRNVVSADQLSALNEYAYLIRVGDKKILFNRDELTEDLANEIKRELGI